MQALADRIVSDFGDVLPRIRFSVKLPGESYQTEDPSELQSVTELPAEIRNLSLHISSAYGSEDRNLSFVVPTGFGRAYVHAEGASRAWCAGAVALVQDFAERHRVWYAPFRQKYGVALLMFLGAFPYLSLWIVGRDITQGAVAWPWAITVLLVLFVVIVWDRSFPSGRLLIREEPSFVRRYQAEIVVTAAVVSAIAVVVAAWLGIA